MQWSDISFHPTSRTLRQFSGLWILFFSGLACWDGLVRERLVLGIVLAVLALTIGPVGLWKPQAVRPIYVGWMILVFPIGWTVSRLILALLYYGVFTPVGVCFQLIGRDALQLRRPTSETYWSSKPATPDVARYLRQF